MKWNFALLVALSSALIVNAEPKDECKNDLRCAEDKLQHVIDKINQEDLIQIYGDMITLEKIPVNDDKVSQTETDPLLSRIDRFLRVHRVRINFPNDGSSADLFGRALGEKNFDFELRSLAQGASEGRSKLKKILIPLLLALKFKAMVAVPIIITLIGLIGISMKALGAGLASLLISGAIALKSLVTPPPPPPRVSYGIIKPHEIHHDHWHRSQEEVSEPYRGWAPEYSEQFEGYQAYQAIP